MVGVIVVKGSFEVFMKCLQVLILNFGRSCGGDSGEYGECEMDGGKDSGGVDYGSEIRSRLFFHPLINHPLQTCHRNLIIHLLHLSIQIKCVVVEECVDGMFARS